MAVMASTSFWIVSRALEMREIVLRITDFTIPAGIGLFSV